MAQRTPLYDTHVRAGGRMVDFAGWELPVQYSGILAEHRAVRGAAGLFDVSHMGEIAVTGPHALAALQHLVTNDLASMKPGDARYSPMCYADGGAVDDLLVYLRGQDDYLVVVNASNKDKDFQWMLENNPFNADIRDVSAQWAQLALQGPRAQDILGKLIDGSALPVKNYTFTEHALLGAPCILSRTGYTGEDGFEVYCPPATAPKLWGALLEAGEEHGLIPCGLGARDTLRLEAAMPLYGHELTAEITPLEAVLGRFVKLDKAGFIGREALLAQKEAGLMRKRVGLELLDRGIAREGATVLAGEQAVGHVTSGTMAPWLNRTIAMALVPPAMAAEGTELQVDVRGRRIPAKVVKLPFYKR